MGGPPAHRCWPSARAVCECAPFMTGSPTDEAPLADDPRGRRMALAEINGRRVNEAIQRGRANAEVAVFVCECGSLGCATTIELPVAEYERVRTSFERFVIV